MDTTVLDRREQEQTKKKKKKRPHSAPPPPTWQLGEEVDSTVGPDGRSFCRGSLPRKKMVEKIREVVAPHVESFNYFLEEGLREAVADMQPVEFRVGSDGLTGDVVKMWVEDATVGFPTRMGDAVSLLTPRECRERGLMYAGPFRATVCIQVGSQLMRLDKGFGDLPLMVGSSRCRLAGKTPVELVSMKEEATECGGYFIVNGIERIIRLLQVNRRNHAMAISRATFKNRGSGFTEKGVVIRCVRPGDQSSITNTVHYLANGAAVFRFVIRKNEYLVPMVLMLRALRDLTDQEIFTRITQGDVSNTFLVARVEIMLREARDYSHYTRRKALTYLGSLFRTALGTINTYSDLECGQLLVDRFVCVHLSSNADKQECIFHMLRKLYAFVQGRCRADNPDSLMNHELLLPGHLYTIFVKEKLEEVLVGVSQMVRKEAREHPDRTATAVRDESFWHGLLGRYGDAIGKKVGYLLATGNIVSRTGLDLMQVSGYTIVAERLNFFRFLSHFRSVHRGQFFTTMKTTTVRKLLPESFGFLCPVHTPDGSPCGLLNHLAAMARLLSFPPLNHILGQDKDKQGPSLELLVSLGVEPQGVGTDDGGRVMPSTHIPVLLDGKVVGGCPPATAGKVVTALRQLKVEAYRDGKSETSLALLEIAYIPPAKGGPFPGLYLFTGPARLLRPVLQLSTRKIELIGPMEQVFMDIAILPHEVRAGVTTHQELDPTNMLSLIASLTPFSDYNQSPRNMYQCQMGKQTMGTPVTSYPHRTDNKLYRILTPQAPLVQTRRHAEYCMDEFPQGTNAVVAVISYTGYDMEDAMILNKGSYDRGFAAAAVYKTKTVSFRESGNRSFSKKSKTVSFSNIRTSLVASKGKHKGRVGELICPDLDRDGLPRVGSWVEEGDALYCAGDEVTGDVEVGKHKESEKACVEAVRLLGDDSGKSDKLDKISITLRFPRRPIIGDKFSSRHGQKGVMSILWPQEDMPFTESGMTPDVIINPHAFPSRMTIGMLIESMAGKSGALHGMYQDSTPFTFHESRRAIDYFGEQLRAAGYSYFGSEPLYSGVSGTPMHADIFIGVVYYQRLRHMVSDKSQVRANGPVNQLTRQPIKGRKRHGGIRFGEMERDALLSHGTSFLLHDRLTNCSDRHLANVCGQCGSFLGASFKRDEVASVGRASNTTAVLASSTGKMVCRLCQGRAQPVVLPYVFRYLANELAAMNIKLTLALKEV